MTFSVSNNYVCDIVRPKARLNERVTGVHDKKMQAGGLYIILYDMHDHEHA